MVVNKAVFHARLERLREYLDLLDKVSQFPVERFLQDPFVYGTAERNLHLAIECLLHIGNHIISDRGFPKPDTYADIFRILREHDVIPESLLRELNGMAAFRNVLVHDYVRLDRKKVHDILHQKLDPMKKLGEIFAEMI